MLCKKEIPDGDGRMNRYDYSYSDEELEQVKERIEKLSGGSSSTSVYFNNHPYGNAAFNASRLMDMFGLPHREVKPVVKLQRSLDEFP